MLKVSSRGIFHEQMTCQGLSWEEDELNSVEHKEISKDNTPPEITFQLVYVVLFGMSNCLLLLTPVKTPSHV
jgi:hypothetical protein